MAKNKKSKKDSIEEIKKEQISKKDETLAKLEKENPGHKYVITVPMDAVIDIQVSGYFRKKFEQVFYYLLSPLSATEIVTTMNNIKMGFDKVPEENLTLRDDVIDTMMTLLNEINYQAAKQKKTVATDQHVNEGIADFLNAHNKEENISSAEEIIANASKYKTDAKEAPIDYIKELMKKEKSNEDSNQ
tara:strand:- start:326 stop:889 length:564 start_codon:yes stop_codon:yes gene_type:complete